MKRISKTILILAIFAWTGNGASLLNASNPHRITRAELEMQQRRPPHDRPQHRNLIMGEKDFQFLYKTIKRKSFEKDRLELLSVGVLDNYFSCRQCAKLLSLYSFDKDKLKVLDIMAKHIVDLDNAYLILDSFRFESDRRKAANMLKLRRR